MTCLASTRSSHQTVFSKSLSSYLTATTKRPNSSAPIVRSRSIRTSSLQPHIPQISSSSTIRPNSNNITYKNTVFRGGASHVLVNGVKQSRWITSSPNIATNVYGVFPGKDKNTTKEKVPFVAKSEVARPPKTSPSRSEHQVNRPPREPWQTQKKALAEKFGERGWIPRKKLSPDALDGIRSLHAQDRKAYSTESLANIFKVSPEAIRRILKSKWKPNEEEQDARQRRWIGRGEGIWTQLADLGVKPPKKWREMGITRPPPRRPSSSQRAKRNRSVTNGHDMEVIKPSEPSVSTSASQGTSLYNRIL